MTIANLCLVGWIFLLLVGFLLIWVRRNTRYTLFWLHSLHHLLFWFLRHGRQWLFFFWGQWELFQVIATRFGLQVSVVQQETLLLLKSVDLAIYAYRAKPAPGQRGRVFETLKDVPWGNLLLGWYLKTLLARIQNGWLHKKSQSHVLTVSNNMKQVTSVPLSQIQQSCCPLCQLVSPEVHRLWHLGSALAVAEADGPFPSFQTADHPALSVEINTENCTF